MVQTTLATWLRKPLNSQENAPSEANANQSLKSSGSTYASVVSNFSIDPKAQIKAGNTPPRSLPRFPPPPAETNASPNQAAENTATETTAGQTAPASRTVSSPPKSTSSKRALPLTVSLSPVTSSTLRSYQRLNSLLLPIPYPQSFYDEILSDPTIASITLLAIWRDQPTTSEPGIVVGGIRCRLLTPFPAPSSSSPSPLSPPQQQQGSGDTTLYISTLGVLAPYRHHGIASHLLGAVVRRAAREHGVRRVAAHVWEANMEALAWYERRGFERLGREEGYYRRLEPTGAWRIVRDVGVRDWLDGGWNRGREGKEEDGDEDGEEEEGGVKIGAS